MGRAGLAVGSYGVAVPVEFLTDQEAVAFGRYGGVPSREALERFFFLDDGARELVFRRRGDHNRLGFSLQRVPVAPKKFWSDMPLSCGDAVADARS